MSLSSVFRFSFRFRPIYIVTEIPHRKFLYGNTVYSLSKANITVLRYYSTYCTGCCMYCTVILTFDWVIDIKWECEETIFLLFNNHVKH